MEGHRPRIKNNDSKLVPIVDPLEYVKNKSVSLARCSNRQVVRVSNELWVSLHYNNMKQWGDENGVRKGITWADVEPLAGRAIEHLLFYSSRVKEFYFVAQDGSTTTRRRVVLQKEVENCEILNVAIEVHSNGLGSYELTVVTAMKTNTFRIAMGEYVIEFFDDNNSVLKKKEQRGFIQVDET